MTTALRIDITGLIFYPALASEHLKTQEKTFFSVRVHKDLNRLQRVVMESPSLAMIKKNWTWLWTVCLYSDHRA